MTGSDADAAIAAAVPKPNVGTAPKVPTPLEAAVESLKGLLGDTFALPVFADLLDKDTTAEVRKEPWTTEKAPPGGNATLFLPCNIKQLIDDEDVGLLIKTALVCYQETGYKFEQLEDKPENTWTSNWKAKGNRVNFLLGYLCPLFCEQIPSYGLGGAKNPHRQGVRSLWENVGLSKCKDKSLLKLAEKKSPDPLVFLFGNSWATAYPIEKKLFDKCNAQLRNLAWDGVNLGPLVRSAQGIIEKKKLSVTISDKLFSDAERQGLKAMAELINTPFDCSEDGLEYHNLAELVNVKAVVEARQKLVSTLKKTVSGMKDERLGSLYAPYTTQRAKEKAQKKKISELKSYIEHTKWYSSFNPTRIAKVLGVTPLTDNPVEIPDDVLETTVNAWASSLTSKHLDSQVVRLVVGAYYEYRRTRDENV